MIWDRAVIRVEPFTREWLEFQGGFDPERMFKSMADCWHSCSEQSMSDVKELTPEFYSLPQIFQNVNHEQFGRLAREGGRVVDGVLLPPWARGNAHYFVRCHREALESEHVSMALHRWVDLVFGWVGKNKTRTLKTIKKSNIIKRFYKGPPVCFANPGLRRGGGARPGGGGGLERLLPPHLRRRCRPR